MQTSTAGTSPRLPLGRFVEGARALSCADEQLHCEWLPDGRTSLVFRVLEDGRGDVSVVGPRTSACIKHVSGVARAVVIKLRPGWAAPLLGIPASELTDRIVLLGSVWGNEGDELYARLAETEGMKGLLDCLSVALVQRVRRSFESSSAHLVRRAARLIDEGEARIDQVAAQLGVSDRHLRRAFNEHVGVSPKNYGRAVRLQRAVGLATSSNDWSRIARDSGYYDQAHLTSDFRQLMGFTPGAFTRQERLAELRCD